MYTEAGAMWSSHQEVVFAGETITLDIPKKLGSGWTITPPTPPVVSPHHCVCGYTSVYIHPVVSLDVTHHCVCGYTSVYIACHVCTMSGHCCYHARIKQSGWSGFGPIMHFSRWAHPHGSAIASGQVCPQMLLPRSRQATSTKFS